MTLKALAHKVLERARGGELTPAPVSQCPPLGGRDSGTPAPAGTVIWLDARRSLHGQD
jgi:hypothetical protein